ncbi:MAG TPA: FecR family protein [Bryobacteraceae bacterium]|jgi:ferric-dicitrate binding protein FerR (iron transport regulator)
MPVRRRAFTAKVSLLLAAMSGVCLAQFPPPSDSGQYAAKVLTMTGQVSILKDMVPIALVEGSMVQVQQMIVTGPDGHAVFQVISDGSTFEVFPNSHLVFRKNAWNVKDLIDLFVGRIRVHIEHFGTVPNPNRILTPTAVISVRGTTFDVTVGEDDETTTVEVEDGMVEVRHALLPSVTKVLGPGDTIKVYKNEPLVARGFDRGTFAHYAMKMLSDAANLAAMRGGRGILGTPGGTSATTGVGDTGKGTATQNTGNAGSTATGAPVPTPPPPPPPPGGLVDPPAPAKHHTLGQVLRSTARYLGRMVGITPPTFGPLEAHGLF